MSFGRERCSYDAHRLYMWLALDGGFGWPGDSWVVFCINASRNSSLEGHEEGL
jgi:hypothetical protein